MHRIRAARGRPSAATAEGTDERGKKLFSLGRWGIPVNVVAVVYQVLAIINLAWPRSLVYDLTGHTWWLQWSAPLFIGGTLIVGYSGPPATARRRHDQPAAAPRSAEADSSSVGRHPPAARSPASRWPP